MPSIFPGRYTAEHEGPLVVFLIGVRINKPWLVHKWWSVFRAMGPMLRTLYQHPEKGFLGGELFLYRPGAAVVQYWRSFDDLERFARNPDDPHLPAWKRFNRAVGGNGSVGIWHETFLVEAGRWEAVYVNMPRFGLGKASGHAPATGSRTEARSRLYGDRSSPMSAPGQQDPHAAEARDNA